MQGSSAPFDVGSIIAGTYRIVSHVGRGGMGMVFLASHERLPGKQVAIKVLHAALPTEEMLARFKREAEIISLLRHPNIVHVEDFNVTPEGTPYLVLEFLVGQSLAERLALGPLAIEPMLSIARQVGSALAAAHARGIVHRDLKPQNIFLVPTEVDGRPLELAKVLDFGISKLLDSRTVTTEDNALLGTPQYMSPEQATGKHAAIDGRTDVFALGVLVHEMLSGRPAFAGTSIPEIVYKVVHEEPEPLPPHVPDAIASAIRRAMAKSADERFTTVSSFVEAMTGQRILAPPHVVAAGSATDDGALAQTVQSENQRRASVAETAPTPRPARRIPTRMFIIAAAVSAVAVVGIVGYALHGSASEGLERVHMRSVATQLMTGTVVEVDGKKYPVGQIGRDHLKSVKFEVGGHAYEAIEQNPDKASRWAELARQGHQVVQFKDLTTHGYVGVVVDGEPADR